MIVPSTRLLVCFVATALPVTIGMAVSPAARLPGLVFLLALAFITLLDAALAFGRLAGIGVTMPAVTRWSKDRGHTLDLMLANAAHKARAVRLGLPLPAEIASPTETILATLPADAAHTRLAWPCIPRKRGVFRLAACYLETPTPLGLWLVRGTCALQGEIRVYPNLAAERKHLAALFLNRGGFGIHAQRQCGKGREFEKLRDYVPGDNYDDIHWKATARRRHPITKLYQIERTQEVYVIIDTSRLSARPAEKDHPLVPFPHPGEGGQGVEDGGRSPDSILERYITASLVLGLAAQKQGDLFGLITFSDAVHGYIRAYSGKAHYGICREQIHTLEPRLINPAFDELFTFIRLKLRRRALLFFLTSLDDPVLAETFVQGIDLIGRTHLVLVNMLRPAGAAPVFSHPEITSTDEIYTALSGHSLWHYLRELEQALARHGVRLAQLENEHLCVDLVGQYLNVKQRQLL